MLKKFEKIEESLNQKLTSLAKGLKKLWILCVPAIVFKKYFQLKAFLKTKAVQLKNFLTKKGQASVRIFWVQYEKVNGVSNAIQSFPIKRKAFESVGVFKSFLVKTPLKNHADLIAKLLMATLDKTAILLGKLRSPQVLIASSAMLMIFFGTYGVYVSSQKIYMQEWGGRAPASQDQYLKRPAYLKYPKRTLKVFNVKVPIYVESVKAIQSVTVDFTVRTDTRFAKQFLEEYEYKLKDHF
ncbi:MAG: hypothetical protein WD025_05185, partial [Bacteriovoracaceae bacterium]